MEWIEVCVPAEGSPEELCDTLLGLGAESFQIEDETDFHRFLEQNTQYWDFVDEKLESEFRGRSRVKFWVSNDEQGKSVVRAVEDAGLHPVCHVVRDSDWENNWRAYYKPMEVGERLVVVPEWEEYSGARVQVRLDPGLLFGTGDHPTTHMCLEAVEKYLCPGMDVLDLGCGSGILGIAAAVLGGGRITAVDVDEKAREIVKENAAVSGVEDAFTVYTGDLVSDARLRRKLGTGYGLVLANIVADVIIPLAPFVPEFMAPDGVFVCSGIIDGREEETRAALEAAGFAVLAHNRREEWSMFACRKEERQ